MMMSRNIVRLVGLPCYLVQEWELGWFSGELPSLYHTTSCLLPVKGNRLMQPCLQCDVRFFTGGFIHGAFMHLLPFLSPFSNSEKGNVVLSVRHFIRLLAIVFMDLSVKPSMLLLYLRQFSVLQHHLD